MIAGITVPANNTTERVFPEDLLPRLQKVWGRERCGNYDDSSDGVP